MFKVYLDPGHYGSTYNKSTTGLNYYESAMTWKLAGYLKAELEKRSVEVGLSRQTINSNPTLYNRGYGAKGYDLFLSLHSNACATESVDYPIVYRGYDKTAAEDFAKKLATVIQQKMGTNNAGKTAIKKGTDGEYYGVLRGARAAGLTYYYIVEHSFHTNTKSVQWLMSDANLKALAVAEAELIVSYFKVSTTTTATTTTTRSYLMKGDKGDDVKVLQENLNYLGYSAGTADGIFGEKTDSAVKAFQKDYKLTVDGKYGTASKAKLEEVVANKKKASTTSTTPIVSVSGSNYIYNGVNYSLVFNPTYYSNKYADLKNAFGTNATNLFKHFIQHGMFEQRRGSANFDVIAYKNRHVDLQKAFGDDYPSYYKHYIQYGYRENRKCI